MDSYAEMEAKGAAAVAALEKKEQISTEYAKALADRDRPAADAAFAKSGIAPPVAREFRREDVRKNEIPDDDADVLLRAAVRFHFGKDANYDGLTAAEIGAAFLAFSACPDYPAAAAAFKSQRYAKGSA